MFARVEGRKLHGAKIALYTVFIFLFFSFYRFVQFIGSLGGVDVDPTCFTPQSPEHSVILQYSNNGGKLDITFYLFQKHDLKV